MSQEFAETMKSPQRSRKSNVNLNKSLTKGSENKNLIMDRFVRESCFNLDQPAAHDFDRDSDSSNVMHLLNDDEPRMQSP
jgi:hypothetical protein